MAYSNNVKITVKFTGSNRDEIYARDIFIPCKWMDSKELMELTNSLEELTTEYIQRDRLADLYASQKPSYYDKVTGKDMLFITHMPYPFKGTDSKDDDTEC